MYLVNIPSYTVVLIYSSSPYLLYFLLLAKTSNLVNCFTSLLMKETVHS